MTAFRPAFRRRLSCLAAAATLLCASSMSWAQQPQETSFDELVKHWDLGKESTQRNPMLERASAAMNAIKRMELPEASKSINEALQLDAHNSYLHFFNGFIYHLQARRGDTQKYEMALEGYRQALRMDASNWIAQEFLGLALLDSKQFADAKEQFAEVLLMAPESAVSVYGLMVSAYMSGDPVTACAMADTYGKVASLDDPAFLRSSASVYASCGEFDMAAKMRNALAALRPNLTEAQAIDRRIGQWKSVFGKEGGATPTMLKARYTQAADPAPASPPPAAPADQPSAPPPAAPAATPAAMQAAMLAAMPPDDGSPRMVLVDVVLVTTQEIVGTSQGINLLNALALQLGSASTPAYANSYHRSGTDVGTVITHALTVPALAYSLNIANANNTVNEVLARPTLAAIEGQPSEFFNGTNLNAAVVSTNSLGNAQAVPVDKRFGVRLAVTPNFLPNGMVKMKVEAQRTFLNANVNSVGFAYRLEISETSSNANVVMRLGDTLVLSGLSEKEADSSRTGVPVLQDVPLVQYLFSNKLKNDFQRSVLILITPRAPVYTSRAERPGQSPAVSESMKAVREKFGFGARTPANVESILNHLRSTNLFREFRQGDVSLERWDRMGSTLDRLVQAFSFLYY